MVKVIRYVWVGPQLQPLGLFNVLSWLAAGWGVVIHHFPPEDRKGAEPTGSAAHLAKLKLAPLIPDEIIEQFLPYAVEGKLDVVHVWCADLTKRVLEVKAGSLLEPLQALFDDLRKRKVANWYYAVADMAKTLTAGACEGIVLDLKIGPSPHADATFERIAGPDEKFYGMKRAGGSTGWENQCMGCGKVNAAQGKYFESALELIASRYLGKRVAAGDEIFQGMTSFHGKMMEKLGAHAINLASETYPRFVEFLAIGKVLGEQILGSKEIDLAKESKRGRWEVNFGPFRVFQLPGHYNWFPKMDLELHRLCVALTMMAVANSGLDERLRTDSELVGVLRALATEVWLPKKEIPKALPRVDVVREIVDDLVERVVQIAESRVEKPQLPTKVEGPPKEPTKVEEPLKRPTKIEEAPKPIAITPPKVGAKNPYTCSVCQAVFENELTYAFHKLKCR